MSSDHLQKVPVRKAEVVIRKEGDVYSIHQQEVGKIFLTNEVGSKVWNMCDSVKTVADIISDVSKEFDSMPIDRLQSDITGFLERCVLKQVMKWS